MRARLTAGKARVAISAWRAPAVLLLIPMASGGAGGVLDLSNLEYSNLRGLGPMRDVEETLRFREVIEVDGVKVDMAITAGDGYTPDDVSSNGLLSRADEGSSVAAISVKAGTAADLKVEFFEAGTTTPRAVPRLFFTVFGLERPSSSEEERLKIKGFDAVYLTRGTALMYRCDADGVAFRPSDGAVGAAVAEPTDGHLLSERQRAHAATFVFHGASAFALSFELTGASGGGALVFGSAANAPGYAVRLPISYILDGARPGWQRREDWLLDLGSGADDADAGARARAAPEGLAFREPSDLETTCSCNLDFTHVEVNNLGGLGPDATSGSMIRYGNVCTVNGRTVDLVIEDVGGYASTAPEANGQSTCGPYGSISVQFGTMAVLKARFLDAETNAATRVNDFFFTVFDVDLHGDHAEKVTIHGFDRHFTSSDTMVSQEEVINGGVFTSPGVLSNVQCPPDPLALTDQQASVGVTALFRGVSEFSFALEVMGVETPRSHNFLFGGTSSLNTDCSGHGLPSTTQTATTSTETASTSTMSTYTTTATSTTTSTFDCSAHDPASPWREEQQDFCCHLDERFCPTTTGTSTTGTTTTTSALFDCTHGLVDQWPKNRSAWCCEHYHAGCATTTTTRPEPFNCTELAPAEWSTEKRAWCCSRHREGCSAQRLPVEHNRTPALSTSTPAPYKGCGEAVTCELRLDAVIHDNLGGMGPDKIEPNVIRYGDVCFTEDGPIDLVISAEGSYEPFNPLDNGKSAWGPYGAINVKLGSTVTLRASFVKSGTDAPAVVASTIFSVFGLYQDSPAHQEAVTVHSFASVHLAAGTYVRQRQVADGATFESTDRGDTLDVADDPLRCSQKQERTSVSFIFRQVSSFALSLTAAGEHEGGRDFLFGGRCCITERCPARSADASGPPAADSGHPYDCQAGLASWRLGWSQVKKDWCCQHEKRGCQFRCDVAYKNWEAAWSRRKARWCCQHDQRGCGTPTTRAPPAEEHDCDVELASMTVEGRKWCCRHKDMGCGSAQPGWRPFDCDAGASSWRSAWPHPKKQWCCANYGQGCEGTTPEPFDCADGFRTWKTSWPPPKLEWCCHNYNRGCANIMRRYEQLPRAARHLGRAFPALLALGGLAALGVGWIVLGRRSRLSQLALSWLRACGGQAYARLSCNQAEVAAGESVIRRMQRLEVDEAPL